MATLWTTRCGRKGSALLTAAAAVMALGCSADGLTSPSGTTTSRASAPGLPSFDALKTALTVARQQGLIASPYRKVWIGDGDFVVPETDPTERNRVAAAVGAKHSFGAAGVHVRPFLPRPG